VLEILGSEILGSEKRQRNSVESKSAGIAAAIEKFVIG
jgi:hypothetical protein